MAKPSTRSRELIDRVDSLNRRMNRVREIGNQATDNAIRELVKALNDSSSAVRYLASTKLLRIGDLRVVEALEASLNAGEARAINVKETRKVLDLIAITRTDPAAQQRARLMLNRLQEDRNPSTNG